MAPNQKRDHTKDTKTDLLVLSVLSCVLGSLFLLVGLDLFLWAVWLGFVFSGSLLFYYLIFYRREAIWHLLIEFFAPIFCFGCLSFSGYGVIAETVDNSLFSSELYRGLVVLFVTLVSGVSYLYLYDVPLWKKLLDINLKKKINLKTGTYSLATSWAGSYDYKKNSIIMAIPSVGGVFAIFLAYNGGGIETITLGDLVILLNVMAGIFGFHKFHYLFRLIQFERQIGRRIIIS
jgi:hypothetical protein